MPPKSSAAHGANNAPTPKKAAVHPAVAFVTVAASLALLLVACFLATGVIKGVHAAEQQRESCIFDGMGRHSPGVLADLLEPGSVMVSDGAWIDNLKMYGPGLVSGFAVHADFLEAGRVSYDGEPTGDFIGEHSMLLIGARREQDTGKEWYMLQNFWPQEHLIQVSREYLEASGAKVTFVVTPQTKPLSASGGPHAK